jgi:hypothetical protein
LNGQLTDVFDAGGKVVEDDPSSVRKKTRGANRRFHSFHPFNPFIPFIPFIAFLTLL